MRAPQGVAVDAKGNVWVGTEREVAMWTGSSFQTMTPTNGESALNVTFLDIAPDGDAWIIANERVRKARERQWVFEAEPCRGLFSGYQDRLGLQERLSRTNDQQMRLRPPEGVSLPDGRRPRHRRAGLP